MFLMKQSLSFKRFVGAALGAFFLMLAPAAWAQPTISSFTPASGPVGTLVTITGTDLSSPTAFSIGGVPAITVSNNGSTLVGMVMPGAATGALIVTTAGGTGSGPSSFTVTASTGVGTQQGAKLVGTGNAGIAQQGYSVSLSADGNTAIVSGRADNSNQGAAWVYTRSGSTWTQQGAKLVGTGNVGTAQQGISVSLSADGNTAMVGGYADNSSQGAAWVYGTSFSATVSYPGTPFCAATGTASVFFIGTNGGTFTATPAGLFIDATTGAIDLAASLPGTYTVRYGISATDFTTSSVSVRPPSFVTAPGNQVACAGGTMAALNFTGPAGLTYSWTNNNASIGLAASGTGSLPSFTAANAGVVAQTANLRVTATGGSGCAISVTSFRITVNPAPVLAAVGNQSLCAGSSTAPVVFSSSLPATLVSWTNNNNAIGLSASGSNGIPAFTAQNNTAIQQTATLMATPRAGSCNGNAVSLTIAVSPSTGTLAYMGSPYCQIGPAVPTRSGSTGGVFSSTPGLDLNAATGSINLGASTPGTYMVTYLVAPNACVSSVSASITIKPQATVNTIGNQVYCNSQLTTAIPFTGNAASYNWTNSDPSIGLAASGSGTNLPSYTTVNAGPLLKYATIRITPQGNGTSTCTGKATTFRITVNYCGPVTQAGDHGGGSATARTTLARQFQIGPNPATGTVVLQYIGKEAGLFTVQILSQYGQPVGRIFSFSGSTYTMDLSGITAGSYQLQVTQVRSGISFNKQLIKL